MDAVGIVAEYNPFHNGHAYHINAARDYNNQPVIVVMSGNFVQRGEPAIIGKFCRARMAVYGGADLVLELPAVFACSSAEYFARGAVQLLNACGIVKTLCCGAETPEKITTSSGTNDRSKFKTALKTGCSYASAVAAAAPDGSLLKPNNILALEYSNAIAELSSSVSLKIIKRIANDYRDNELTGNISSATAIRAQLSKSNSACEYLPVQTGNELADYLSKYRLCTLADFWPVIRYKLLITKPEYLKNHGMREGLENRFAKAAQSASSTAQLLEKVKSRRYTYSRLQRILINILLELQDNEIEEFRVAGPQYFRPLAWNQTGEKLLRNIAEKNRLPIITQPAKFFAANPGNAIAVRMLALDIKATKIHSIVSNTDPLADFRTKAQKLLAPD